jgi:hypothetical protein
MTIWPAVALADWEFARWGMTVDEVLMASRYSAIPNGQGYGCLAEMPGPVTFQGARYGRVKFCFDSNTLLEAVELVAEPNAFHDVEKSLNKAYGPSRQQRNADTWVAQWKDGEGGNAVRLARGATTVVTISDIRKERNQPPG